MPDLTTDRPAVGIIAALEAETVRAERVECAEDWPCLTVTAITTALEEA